MELYLTVGLGVLAPFGVLALLFFRRIFIARNGGTIDMSVRLSQRYPGRGWAPGLARFDGDHLRWYRIFSFSPRPRITLHRHDLAVVSRRDPLPPELVALPAGSVILHCKIPGATLDVAINSSAVAGFLSWLEAGVP